MGARSRNQRRAALRSFFHYAAFEMPEASGLINKVLAMPSKRHDRALVQYLSVEEIDALIKAPDRSTWIGRRDHVLLAVAIQTGLRVSELVNIRRQDVSLDGMGRIQCTGKGRKERCTPLTRQTNELLRNWFREVPGDKMDPVFLGINGGQLSTDAVQFLLKKYVAIAKKTCPSLAQKRVSPHVLRHTTAMQLLLAGVDRAVIALWLGHASVETTQVYLEANLKMKEDILKRTNPMNT